MLCNMLEIRHFFGARIYRPLPSRALQVGARAMSSPFASSRMLSWTAERFPPPNHTLP